MLLAQQSTAWCIAAGETSAVQHVALAMLHARLVWVCCAAVPCSQKRCVHSSHTACSMRCTVQQQPYAMPSHSNANLSSVGVIAYSHIRICSALQHPDIGRIQSSCCEAVSNGIYVSAHGMIRCCPIAVQHCIEGSVLHLQLYCLAVLISCLLVPLLLEGSIASL